MNKAGHGSCSYYHVAASHEGDSNPKSVRPLLMQRARHSGPPHGKSVYEVIVFC